MPDKPIFLTHHARNKQRHWKFSLAELEDILDNPDGTAPSVMNRVNYWKRWRNAWLQVTAVDEGDRIVIVTVTPRPKLG